MISAFTFLSTCYLSFHVIHGLVLNNLHTQILKKKSAANNATGHTGEAVEDVCGQSINDIRVSGFCNTNERYLIQHTMNDLAI